MFAIRYTRRIVSITIYFGVVILETRLRTDVIVSMVANGCNKLIGATQTFFDSQPDSSVG